MLTDPMAATVAENALNDLLQRRVEDNEPWQDPRHTARAVIDQYSAAFEYRSGQRRVVLTSSWEVDPAAHVAPLVAAEQR